MAEAKVQRPSVTCKVCGAAFEKRTRGPSRYCGAACRRSVEADKEKMRNAAAGKVCPGVRIDCRRCGVGTEATGPAQRYCAQCKRGADAERYARYRAAHPEKVRAVQQANDKKRRAQPERKAMIALCGRRRRQTPRGRLDHRISQLVRNGLGTGKNGRTWESLVGYSLTDLYVHLERQFTKGMGWHNTGKWEVDHILPRCMFKYESSDDPDFRACWALTNLRPLWAEVNRAKSGQRLHLI